MSSPVLTSAQILSQPWEQNATRYMGIALHPLGELNAYEYIKQMEQTATDMSPYYLGFFFEATLAFTVCGVYVRNAFVSISLLRERPTAIPGWCSLFEALSGITWCSLHGSFLLGGVSCRSVQWYSRFGAALSNMCIVVVLLQKAYLAQKRQRWLLITPFVMSFTVLPIAGFGITWPALVVGKYGCIAALPSYFPWLLLASEMPFILVCSYLFSSVAYRQYRNFGSKAWEHLARDSIQIMCYLILTNTLCLMGVGFKILGPYSGIFYTVRCFLNSTLFVQHIQPLRKKRGYNRPRAHSSSVNRPLFGK
ncbi:hypothetical protein THASP1DRAFT_33024 [Thamnocephalis sphaerospora]|uniref:Uncharacterized protein n=1 Tax=Thamnocephalis sphaerospora TaxID=78915 RepID=A0A4P9XHP5_9FUNG|nr:hypothetical protein THASP1DRAFT_33024 [Thamnocephalis sphaerospora]|eukprot:RKP05136.1 hypothetical protein THASP1DRAFT_33024 [Thamnocephalis sphaerospora]